MFYADVHQLKGEAFRVLSTTGRTQLAVMTLQPGRSTGSDEGHPDSDQLTLVLEGRVEVKADGQTRELRAGEVVVIPPATPHKFRALGRRPVTMVAVYGPPAYPADEGRGEGPAALRPAEGDHTAAP